MTNEKGVKLQTSNNRRLMNYFKLRFKYAILEKQWNTVRTE